MVYIDEDLILAYKCRICGMTVCKDEAFAKQEMSCECLDCSENR